MYLRPATLNEALSALAGAPARILSGGTDLYPAMVERACDDALIDLSRIEALRGIAAEPDAFRIGARATWREVIRADLPPCFDALKAAAREVGSVQIQHVATLAGNLCNASPAADGVPPLLALDAAVELASASGTRTLPLAAFLQGNRRTLRRPDEMMTAILVPRGVDTAASVFAKLGARRYLVISVVMVAVVLDLHGDGRVRDARIAVGACSAVAQRLRALEAEIVAAPAGADLAGLAAPGHFAALAPIDDVRASAAYRQDAALTLVRRALGDCLAKARTAGGLPSTVRRDA